MGETPEPISLEVWVGKLKKLLEELDKMKPTDRLMSIACITSCMYAIDMTIGGWQSWLTTPAIANQLTKEELEECFIVYNVIAKKLLEFDLKITNAQIEKDKEANKKKGKKNHSTNHYIG
jgi:hypothetical protein